MSEPESEPESEPRPEVVFDFAQQRDAVAAGLLPGERLVAVLDAVGTGTGFLGLTDARVLLQDRALVGGRSTLVSIPYGAIISVGFVADSDLGIEALSSSTIAITVSGAVHQVAFRGADKARYAHDTVLWHVLNG